MDGNAQSLAAHWADWFTATRISQVLQGEPWLIPIAQSLHIVALSMVAASALMISLRLLGVQQTSGRPIPQLIANVIPWMYGSLCISLLTGVVLMLMEPMRQFSSPAFWSKLLLLALVVGYTVWFVRQVRVHVASAAGPWSCPPAAKVFALTSMVLWIGIIFCGRFIAYTHG